MYKILMAVEGDFEKQREILKNAGFNVSQRSISSRGDLDFAKKISGFDCVIMGGGSWNRNVFKYAGEQGSLKIISKFGVGVDNIDLEAASEYGIAVTNAPGSNSNGVAEHTLALILAITRRIPLSNDEVKSGIWNSPMTDTIMGKTIGLMGFGNIGKKLAKFLTGFPVKLIAYDLVRDWEEAKESGVKYVELDELIVTSDVISIHLPLTKETGGMVNSDFLNRMKSSAYLVNTGRGPIINERDLIQALKNNTIRGAALDTFETEPPLPGNELMGLKNVICTPHCASNTKEAYSSIMDCCVDNIISFFNKGICKNVVNEKAICKNSKRIV